MINSDMEGGLIGEIMKRTTQPSPADISFQVQLPNEWDSTLAKKNVGVSAFVETDICNSSWVNDHCNNMDMIVVPSEHVKQTIKNSGISRKPINVIPESFYECALKNSGPLDLDFETDFNFLIFGQLTGQNPENDRKNVFYTLKWLCEIFSNDPDVGVIIKTNSGSNSQIDRGITNKIFQKLLQEVRTGPYPRVHMLHGEMTPEEVCSLYRHPKINALLSLTRGEGYGLPLLEAAACDLPVIATNWSGHLDFLNRGKWIKVKHDLHDVHQSRIDGNIFIEGSKWAAPNEQDAKQKILKFRKSNNIPRQWARDLGKTLRKEFSHEAICPLYDSALAELLEK